MAALSSIQARLRAASEVGASLWVAALALAAGAGAAWVIIHFLPARTDDVALARALGIVSETILAGHSKSADSRAYAVGMSAAVICSVAIWTLWAMRAGANRTAVSPSITNLPRITLVELVLAAFVAFGLFGRIWNGRAATVSAWSALSEEGEMLAWVDTVLRGGALSRDTFCLYGPLSVWAVAALFCLCRPSLGLWRLWIFGLNAAALIAAYWLLRSITRTRIAASAGALTVGILCIGSVPAMSWSLSRVGFGLAAITSLHHALDRRNRAWHVAAGALAAMALLYSPEVGASCAVAFMVVLLLYPSRRFGLLWTITGTILVLVPTVLYLIATNSFWATINNVTLFSRVKLLGFAALIFPQLEFTAESLRAYFVPAVIAVAAFSVATKLLRGQRDARTLTELALVLFGGVLFNAAVSRPDDIHLPFVAPPALILLTILLEDAWFALRVPERRVPAVLASVLAFAALIPWASTARDDINSLFELPTGRALDLPRGGGALFPDEFAHDLEQLVRAIESRTAPDEPIWIFPNEALLYFLADRPQPTHFPLAIFAITRDQREELIGDLERTRPRWAVVYRDAARLDRVPYFVALPEVIAYLDANYEFERNIGAFILMRRKS